MNTPPRRRFFLVAVATATALLALAVHGVHGVARPINVGAIFHKGDEDLKSTFHNAIYRTRYEKLAPAFNLVPVIIEVDVDTDSFNTGIAACDLLKSGVAAIFGPPSPHTRGVVASIAARFDVPHIEYVWREPERIKNPSSMTINVFPDSEMLGQAFADVVDSMKWQSFVIIYDSDEALSRVQKILTIKRDKDSTIIVRQLGEGSDYRAVLKEINSMHIFNVVLDVDQDKIVDVLNQAKQVKLLAYYSNFIITYLDSSKLPIAEIRNNTTANITVISLRENDLQDFEIKSIESAILYDAVFLFNKALEALNARNIDYEDPDFIDPLPISCNDGMKYLAGSNITNIFRELSKMGKLTGKLEIDEYGHRQYFNINILNFRQSDNLMQIGYWSPNSGGVHPTETEHERESYLVKSIKEKNFKISTKVGAPYIIEIKDGEPHGTNFVEINKKLYEGYCIDLIQEIANILEFKYTFELVPDNLHGSLNPITKKWNGLIRRLLDHEADLAICDFTITFLRESAVDFSMPFMNLGISILYSKPEEKIPELFSFLSPLSVEVWMYMATAYLMVSLMLFLQARIAPGEWDNPHPCNAEPEELENNFDLKNSMWLTIGSLMQQGSDILPKAASIRMLAGMWWFFTLIMISSYTANLAAFLTAEKMDTPIKNVEDLAKQTKIKYGAMEGGSTSTFFQNSNYSTYKRMWNAMEEAKPSVFTKDNDEGLDRVVRGKRAYAFLMESTTIEYKMERICDIDKIGGLIDNKGYGIALPRNSPYRTLINGAILKLGEKGTLYELKQRWWREKGGGKCMKAETDKVASTAELGLLNVGGVFLVLIFGCVASMIIAICEFLWNIRKVAVREKITPMEALVGELKFAVNVCAVTKPVKIVKSRSASSSSSMEGRLGRAASTARSIVGSFLRLDMLDRFDKDANTNNRSNDRKIN